MTIRLVSACLAGMHCRYDGQSRTNAEVVAAVDAGTAVPACPEMLGGLTTPRQPAEIVGGDGDDVLDGIATVRTDDGEDVTAQYVVGARRALAIATAVGAEHATLHQRSPSCGCGQRYDGTFTGSVTAGAGVTAALLRRNGITVTPADRDPDT
ncbi:DUF523 domain-containing protein [Pseudonocardia sp. TRM90224]|uniref:DUF523 domain-containing protein n=1 Tax=Pseudonocardia sp. TRM90224 TaxID=2812678 RepID=UPI001E58D449|nr:DUF523 domain-containing protein [Pseudonocardia sp. TRM90224]